MDGVGLMAQSGRSLRPASHTEVSGALRRRCGGQWRCAVVTSTLPSSPSSSTSAGGGRMGRSTWMGARAARARIRRTRRPTSAMQPTSRSAFGLWYRFNITDDFIAEVASTVQAYKDAHPTTFVVCYMHVGPNFQWVPYGSTSTCFATCRGGGSVGTSSHHIQRFEVTGHTHHLWPRRLPLPTHCRCGGLVPNLRPSVLTPS